MASKRPSGIPPPPLPEGPQSKACVPGFTSWALPLPGKSLTYLVALLPQQHIRDNRSPSLVEISGE